MGANAALLDNRPADRSGRANGRRDTAADASPSLIVEWRPLAELERELTAWQELCERALEPNVFYDPAFALAAGPSLGHGVRTALVWSASRTRLLGLFPFRREHRYGPFFPILSGWTHPYAPLGTPLVDRDSGDQVMDAILGAVARSVRPWTAVLMPFLPDKGPVAAMLDRVVAARRGRIARFGRHERALLAPDDNQADYLAQATSGRRRKEWRRLRHRLEEAGRLRLETDRDPVGIAQALADFCALEAQGSKGAARTAMAGHPDILRFAEQAIVRLAADRRARIDRLLLGDRTIAAAIALRSGDTGWFWKISYDESYSRFSPGVQLALDLTQSLLGEPGLARVDSCAVQDHPMIDHLWRERRALSDLLVVPGPHHPLAFRLTCRLEALRRLFFARASALAAQLKLHRAS
jgi:CelD/BcsL family acetyltransferase involved in cellulose biosynthesis